MLTVIDAVLTAAISRLRIASSPPPRALRSHRVRLPRRTRAKATRTSDGGDQRFSIPCQIGHSDDIATEKMTRGLRTYNSSSSPPACRVPSGATCRSCLMR
jgi:hypothetical protein